MKKFYSILFLFFLCAWVNYSCAQWQQTSGPTNGNITSLVITGSNIFAGAYGGVYLSANNAGSWTAVNNGLTNPNVHVLAANGSTIAAGTSGGGVFLSTNLGSSWAAVNTGLSGAALSVNTIIFNGSNIFLGTNSGVFLSINNGNSWTAMSNGLINTVVNSLATSGTNIFAGTNGGVFLSTNNGSSWTAMNNGFINTWIVSLAIMGTNIFAGTYENGVYLSTNNGSNWAAVNNGFRNANNTYMKSLAVIGTTLFAATGYDGIYSSSNNGSSWMAMNNGIESKQPSFVAGTGSTIFAGTDLGVYLSTNNGGSWSAVNNGLASTAYISALAVSGSNIVAMGNGLYVSPDNGSSWNLSAANGSSTVPFYTLVNRGTKVFAGCRNYGLYSSSDNGVNWHQVTYSCPMSASGDFLSLASSGSTIIAGMGEGDDCMYMPGVYLSHDNGNNWTGPVLYSEFNSFAFNGTNIFAGSHGGGIYVSSNDGSSWATANNGLTNHNINAIAVSGTNIYAVTDSGMYLSSNNGSNWMAVNNGLINTHIYTILISGGTTIFAGTGGGVFLSTNNGSSWTAVNSGLSTTAIRSLAINVGAIFAGTDAKSVWKRPLSQIVALSTSAISNSTLCAGSTLNVTYATGTAFNSGNVFTAQLSDANGGFTNPVNIGSLTSMGSGTIVATVPANITAGSNYRIRVVSSNPVMTGTDNGSNITVNTVLNLNCYIQGYYLSSGGMKKVLYNEQVETNPASTNVDTLLVELHNAIAPYSVVETFKGVLQTNSSLTCSFSCAVSGHSYYIAVKHKNMITTWSALPVSFTSETNYDFTTSNIQAYGNNMIQMETGRWAFFSGDINQDTNIDLLDFPTLDLDINHGFYGYYVCDLNGDGNVDLLDFPLLDGNIVGGVFSMHP